MEHADAAQPRRPDVFGRSVSGSTPIVTNDRLPVVIHEHRQLTCRTPCDPGTDIDPVASHRGEQTLPPRIAADTAHQRGVTTQRARNRGCRVPRVAVCLATHRARPRTLGGARMT